MTERGRCVVIGAGPGVGLAVARQFARGGFALTLIARGLDGQSAPVVALRAEGFAVDVAKADAGDPVALAAQLSAIEAEHGPVEVLVYNAAAATPALPTALPAGQLLADLAVSVGGAQAAARALAPAMIARARGTMLFTGGGFALYPNPALASLSIGKAAIRSLALCLDDELAPRGVRVGTVTIMGPVAPGTPFDPEHIAQAFWRLHADRAGALGPELQFTGGQAWP